MKELSSLFLVLLSVVATVVVLDSHIFKRATQPQPPAQEQITVTQAEVAGLMTQLLRLEWRVKVLETKMSVITPQLEIRYSGRGNISSTFQEEEDKKPDKDED